MMKERTNMNRRRLFSGGIAWFVILAVLGFLLWTAVPGVLAMSDKIYRELEVFARIIDILDKQYVEPVDEHRLVEGAIHGMLSALDPHTVYLPPDMYRDFKSDTQGQFGGVGIEITIKEGILTVVAPIEDSPAYRAGIRSGDRIIKIDGESTKGMSLVDAVHHMRGPGGKKVVLTVWHENTSRALDLTVTREIIKVDSVKHEALGDGLGYVRIVSFQEKTSESLKKTLKALEDEEEGQLKGIVLDLRDNPGGLLSEAVRVADIFLEKGTIVSTRGRDKEVEVKKARKGGPYENMPVLALVNHGSASAAEIVAGALQDSRRAKILGTASFGKGSVQSLVDLGNKSALKITIAKYYTPRGRSIEGRGIVPDILLGEDQLKKDFPKKEGKAQPTLEEYQKEKAIEHLKKTAG